MSQTRDQKRFTVSEVAADWHELTIPQRTMGPSIARVSEQLDPQSGVDWGQKSYREISQMGALPSMSARRIFCKGGATRESGGWKSSSGVQGRSRS